MKKRYNYPQGDQRFLTCQKYVNVFTLPNLMGHVMSSETNVSNQVVFEKHRCPLQQPSATQTKISLSFILKLFAPCPAPVACDISKD